VTAGGGCIVVAGSGDEYSYSEKGHPAGRLIAGLYI